MEYKTFEEFIRYVSAQGVSKFEVAALPTEGGVIIDVTHVSGAAQCGLKVQGNSIKVIS